MVNVKKRSGVTELFNREKIKTALTKVGADEATAEEITKTTETWVTGLGKEAVLSLEIRTKVMEFLGAKNPELAKKFGEYTKAPEAQAAPPATPPATPPTIPPATPPTA